VAFLSDKIDSVKDSLEDRTAFREKMEEKEKNLEDKIKVLEENNRKHR
jgi:hypothetical protein